MLASHLGITGSRVVLYLDSRAATMVASTRAVGGGVEWSAVYFMARCRVSFASTLAGMWGQQSRGRADG